MSWRRFWQRRRCDEDLAQEIESYLAHEADLRSAEGLAAEEAVWAARRKLGNKTAVKERVWEMNSLGFIESVWQDVRYAARMLRLNPGFFAVATISLALGIGANTAIFQLLDAVRLRMLPVRDPQQLVELKIAENEHCCNGSFSGRRPNFTFAQWERIRDQQQAFSSLFAWGDTQFNLTPSGEAHLAEGLWVTGEYFKTLGVTPLLGRLIESGDDTPACSAPGVVISYPFWQGHFGGAAGVLEKSVLLNGQRFPVMGVTPASFYGVEVGRSFDVMLPVCAERLIEGDNSATKRREAWWLAVMGRLRPGWTIERAMAHIKTISPAVFEDTAPPMYRAELAQYYRNYKLTALPAGSGISQLRKEYDTPLILLLGIAGLVLLIACANLANLTLARASVREREIAVRLAIGAGRGRLIRQLLSESLLLTAVGTALGIALAELLCRYMVKFLNVSLQLTPDWRLLGFTAALAILTCLLFGLTPALRATRTAPADAMKTGGRGLTASREGFSLRRVLVVGQVALSLVLLAAALLFVGSLRNLSALDAGLRREGLMIMGVDISRLNFTSEQRAATYRTLLENVRATPGVESAANTHIVPLSGDGWNDNFEIPGRPLPGHALAWFSSVSAGYFHALGTQLMAGRDFAEHETTASAEVAIVNEEFCRKFLNGANPLGLPIHLISGPGEPDHQFQIVGLVKNTKYLSLREETKPIVFVAESQRKDTPQGINVLVRSHLAAGALTLGLKGAVKKTNPEMSISFLPFRKQVEDSLLKDRLMATLSSFFGFLAAALAVVGLYGVISYMVARRRGEIGIRMALGATRRGVTWLILKEAGWLLAAGLAVGTIMAISSGRAAEGLLFGLKPNDPWTITSAVLLLAGVALIASLIPALRAARTEPMTALREE